MRPLQPLLCVALACLVTSAAACGSGPSREGPIESRRVAGTLPKDDPRAAAWSEAPDREIDMMPQSVSPPILSEPSVGRVRVRSLHDGEWIAFRLEWDDATEDALSGVSRMSDAVAVELPGARGPLPSPMMGHQGETGRVTILYWRAGWQNADPMAANYPNRPPVSYPAEAAAEGPARDQLRKQYTPALNAGNPTVVRHGDGPGFRAEAEGFGTLSPAAVPEISARGVHEAGHWYVVLAMPIGAVATSVVAPGQDTSAAFAVWNGSAGNIGGRKMWSGNWIPLKIVAGGS